MFMCQEEEKERMTMKNKYVRITSPLYEVLSKNN